MTILLTAFEPFGGDPRNPSQDIGSAVVRALRDGGQEVMYEVLPCAFRPAEALLRKLIDTHTPELVVSLGVAAGRKELTVERVAVNLIDARIPDNAGAQPIDEPVVLGAPAAYISRYPVKRAVQAAQENGIACQVSYSAGTYVCNQVMFVAAHATAGTDTRTTFVHVPMPAESEWDADCQKWARGVIEIVRVGLDAAPDLKISAGREY